ncbi:MAG: Maf family protein [Actinomycetota bacterium]|nr:Maf family protein [Actinomycetota bacterium]
MPSSPPLLLASRSPQRRAILEQLGIAFEVLAVDVPEDDAGEPVAVARTNARRKALSAARRRPDRLVLAVDTVVALEGEIFGKPPDAAAARRSLARLSGRTHEVISGLALGHGDSPRVVHEVTAVTFRELDDETIDRYVATGEWRERAGGYAIQGRGAAIVRAIAGDYLNVVGLPVAALLDLDSSLMLRQE